MGFSCALVLTPHSHLVEVGLSLLHVSLHRVKLVHFDDAFRRYPLQRAVEVQASGLLVLQPRGQIGRLRPFLPLLRQDVGQG